MENIIIKHITAEETIPLRISILRNGKLEPTPHHPEDTMPETFHLGAFLDGNLVGIASFHPVIKPEYGDSGFQLRGMGVLPNIQKKGIGETILQTGLQKLKDSQVNYCWCNARKIAFPFYEKMGFSYISDEFEIPIIGLHKIMIVHL